jgi:drug/metabolite transporter (DMT)-like permease
MAPLVLLVLLTLVWGVNWPVMKLGVTAYPPLAFRALSIWIGVPILGAALLLMKVPFSISAPQLAASCCGWRATNMFVWHACIILAVRTLSSGRAAILGYTMPIFSAVIGALLFSTASAGAAGPA